MGDSLFQVSHINCNENDNTSFYPMHIVLSSAGIEEKATAAKDMAIAILNKIRGDIAIKPFINLPGGLYSPWIKAGTIGVEIYKLDAEVTQLALKALQYPDVGFITSAAAQYAGILSGSVNSLAATIEGVAMNTDPNLLLVALNGAVVIGASYLALHPGNIVDSTWGLLTELTTRLAKGLVNGAMRIFTRTFRILSSLLDGRAFVRGVSHLLGVTYGMLTDEMYMQEMFEKAASIAMVKTKQGWNALLNTVSWSDLNTDTSGASKTARFLYIAAAITSFTAITLTTLISPAGIAATIAFKITSEIILSSLCALDNLACIKDCEDHRSNARLPIAKIRELCKVNCDTRPSFGVAQRWTDHFKVTTWLGLALNKPTIRFAKLAYEGGFFAYKKGKQYFWDTKNATKIPVRDIQLDAGFRSFLITAYPQIVDEAECLVLQTAIEDIERSKRDADAKAEQERVKKQRIPEIAERRAQPQRDRRRPMRLDD